jgi:hypothetical protein
MFLSALQLFSNASLFLSDCDVKLGNTELLVLFWLPGATGI